MNIRKTSMSTFEKIILFLTIIFILVYIGLILYSVSTDKKWNPQIQAVVFTIEFISYSLITLSVIYYITSYFRHVTNTKIINNSLFSENKNQNVLSYIFSSLSE